MWTRAGAAGIILSGRRKEKLEETIEALRPLNTGSTKFLAVTADVSKEADTNSLFAQVDKSFSRPADVVFANAGAGPTELPLAEGKVATWWSTFVSLSSLRIHAMLSVNDLQETNVLGVHNTVVSWIKSQPDPQQPVGTIINVNSGLAGLTLPRHSAYSVSKLASHKYMEYVAVGKFDRCLVYNKHEAWTIDLT